MEDEPEASASSADLLNDMQAATRLSIHTILAIAVSYLLAAAWRRLTAARHTRQHRSSAPAPLNTLLQQALRTPLPPSSASTKPTVTIVLDDDEPFTSHGRQQAARKQQAAAPAPQPPSTLDAALLEQCRQNERFISSVEGLASSPAFQAYLRKKGLGFGDRARRKMELMAELRRVDPSAFQRLWDQPNVQEYDSVPPPRWLLMAEHLSATGVTVALAYAMHAAPGDAGCQFAAVLWLALQAHAWASSHSSFVARLWQVYLVRGRYEQLAPPWRVAAAGVLEAAYAALTLGLGVPLTLALMCCSAARQTLGQRLLGIYPIREVSQPLVCQQYWSPSPQKVLLPAARVSSPGVFGMSRHVNGFHSSQAAVVAKLLQGSSNSSGAHGKHTETLFRLS